jgi:hypothetical protein
MLVPDFTVVPPPIAVDKMLTPGATTDMLAPKLLKVAQQSSHPYVVPGPSPPGRPSVSVNEPTAITSGNAAGTVVDRSRLEFPADTTYVTPAFTELQMACRSELDAQEVPAVPPPLRLILTTEIPSWAAFAVTQSIPQMIPAHDPLADAPSTFTE